MHFTYSTVLFLSSHLDLFPLYLQSESSLDDEAMMAVDEALGQVFRMRFALKHQKKEQKGLLVDLPLPDKRSCDNYLLMCR